MKAKIIAVLISMLFFGLILVFYGCSKGRVEELKKEKLFAISIGDDEEEIGVVKEPNGQFIGPSNVLFRNGFFYVVDTVNAKILKITTPGDVILVLARGYEQNDQEDDILRTKQRKYYPFNTIGQIAIDNENNIYIEEKTIEKLPEKDEIDLFITDSSYEEESDEIYKSHILKFDRLGNYLFRIGEDGKGSDPFYYVYKMEVDAHGNLIIITADENWKSWVYHKFDRDGNMIFKSKLHVDDVFTVEDMEDTAFFIMDVLPVCSSSDLIYWISVYNTSYDTKEIRKEEDLWGEEIEIDDLDSLKEQMEETEKKANGRDLLYYKLLYYNLETNEIDKSYKWENRLVDQVASTEELFGIDGQTNSFFWKYINNTKAIISIYRPNGSLITRRGFVFENEGLWTNVQVAIDGSVCALKIDDKKLHFYRWRSDKLINNKGEKVTIREFIKDKIQEFKNANR